MERERSQSRNIRVFVSSTFQDMQAERDTLVAKVFPKLRKMAAGRGVELTEIDLRWGITEQEAQSGKVVEICLDEIRNSRPFFIGLLGERYGWNPTKESLMELDAMPARYEWLAGDLDRGMSITEIEIRYGVLRAAEPVHASFYIRNTADTDPRQKSLKEAVRNNGRYNVYDYDSAEQMGEYVEREFEALLNRLYPEDDSEDPAEREIRAFIDDKSKNYVPDAAYTSRLDRFLEEDEARRLVVTGESGIGKSVLLGWWLGRVIEAGEWNVAAYFSANSSRSSDLTEITEKLIARIDSLYGLEQAKELDGKIEQDAAGADNVDIAYKKLALRASLISGQMPLLIVMDGVNQFADHDRKTKLFNWLPEFPDNVKIIFSLTGQDEAMQVFKRNGYPVMTVYPLLLDQRKRLIEDFFDYYRKRLSAPQIEMILKGNDITDNTMVLVSLLEEMRCFGSFDDLTGFVGRMVGAADTVSFFDLMLGYKEQRYDSAGYPSLTADLLSLIALSRDGLSETELLAISGIPQLYWSQFFCGNTMMLVIRNGLVTFTHDMIRQAAERRYAYGPNRERLRGAIIDYFTSEESNESRRTVELPYQLYRAGRWNELHEYISHLGYMRQKFRENGIHEFIQYWRALREADAVKYDIAKAYINKFTDTTGDAIATAMVQKALLQYFRGDLATLANVCVSYLGDPDAAWELAQFLIRMNEQLSEDDPGRTKGGYHNLAGIISRARKDYDQALVEFYEGLLLETEAYGEESLQITPNLNNIAEIYCCIAESGDTIDREVMEKSRVIYEQTLEIRKALLPEFHQDIAVLYDNLAIVYSHLGDKEKALEYGSKGRAILIGLKGEQNSREVAVAFHNHAMECLRWHHDLDSAREYCLKALDIYRNLLGEDNSNTLEEYLLFAEIEANCGDLAAAIENMERALAGYRKAGRSDMEFVESLSKLSIYYFRARRPDRAIETAMECVDRLDALEQTGSELAGRIYDNMGKFFITLNDESQSEYYYLKAAETWRLLENREKEVASLAYLASAYVSFDRLEEAAAAMIKNQKLLGAYGLDRTEAAAYSNQNYAAICMRTGEMGKALEYLETAWDIRRELFGEDDPMAMQYKDSIEKLRRDNANGTNHVDRERPAGDEERSNEETEEFAAYAGEENTELIDIFRQGRDAFHAANIERAADLFRSALYLCDKANIDGMSLARSLIYRYLAYSVEIQKNGEQAQEYYDTAAEIAIGNKNDSLAARILKDAAEFNWNRGNFRKAGETYCRELQYLLKLYGFYNINTIACLTNLPQTMLKQEEKEMNWKVVLRCSELVYILTNDNDDYEKTHNNAGQGIGLAIEKLSETESGFDKENYSIDLESGVVELMGYMTQSGFYGTAYRLYRSYGEQFVEQNGITGDGYFRLNVAMMEIDAHIGDWQGVVESCLVLLEKAEVQRPSDAIMSRMEILLADGYRHTMRFAQAIPLYEANPERAPGLVLSLSECYCASGRPEDALRLLDEAGSDLPRDDRFHGLRGKILLDMDRLDEAVEELNLCDPAGDEVTPVSIHRAMALHLSGNEDEAAPPIRTAMDLAEDDGYDLRYRISIGMELVACMMRIGYDRQADSLADTLRGLFDELGDAERDSYSRRLDEIKLKK